MTDTVTIDRALLVHAITWLRGYSHNLRSRLQPETAEETLFVNEPNRIADEIVLAMERTI